MPFRSFEHAVWSAVSPDLGSSSLMSASASTRARSVSWSPMATSSLRESAPLSVITTAFGHTHREEETSQSLEKRQKKEDNNKKDEER